MGVGERWVPIPPEIYSIHVFAQDKVQGLISDIDRPKVVLIENWGELAQNWYVNASTHTLMVIIMDIQLHNRLVLVWVRDRNRIIQKLIFFAHFLRKACLKKAHNFTKKQWFSNRL